DRQRGEVFGQLRERSRGNRINEWKICAGAGAGSRPGNCEGGVEADFQAFLSRAGAAGDTRQGNRARFVYCPLRGQAARRTRLGGKRRARPRQHLRAAIAGGEMSRILVVEDEAHLAEGLRFNLEAEGYQVRVVETGEAALDLLLR